MKKLKEITIEKLIIIYILIQPLLDVATSLCLEYISPYLTLGILIRTMFMGLVIIYSLFKADKKNRIRSLIYYGLVGIYMCIFLFVAYSQNGTNMILAQIKGLIRVFYLPLVLVALYSLFNSKTIKIDNKYFIWTLAEYVLIMLIAKIAGIAYPTYKYGLNHGTVGLFYAANETGAIISILSPLLAIELLKDKKINIINILTLILLIFSVLEMGTKVPFLAFIILYVLFFIICLIKIFIQKNKKIYIIKNVCILIIGIIILFILPYTPVGKNIEANYGIKLIQICKTPSAKQPGLDLEEPIDIEKPIDIEVTTIVSGRNELFKKNLERYMKSSATEKIFGNGYLTYKDHELQINKLVEIDYFDILFSHGIVGTIILFIPLIYMLLTVIIKTLKHFILVLKDEELFLYLYIIGIGLGIALAAGHVLTAPAVSIYMILILLNLDANIKKLEVNN